MYYLANLACHTLQKNQKGLVKCAYKSGVIPPESGGAYFGVHSLWRGVWLVLLILRMRGQLIILRALISP